MKHSGPESLSLKRNPVSSSLQPDTIRNVTPQNPDFVPAGAGLSCWGEKFVVSIERSDKVRIQSIKPDSPSDMTAGGPAMDARYCLETFSPEPIHELMRSEYFTSLYSPRPLVDKFSDGSILFITQPSENSKIPLAKFPNGIILKQGLKRDEFPLSSYPSSAHVDAHDNIWVCPSEQDLEGFVKFLPRGESEYQDLGILAPLCFDKHGHLKRSRMPWASEDQERAELCRINIKAHKTAIFHVREGQFGIIIDKDEKPSKWKIWMMAKNLYAFAFKNKSVLTCEFDRVLRLYHTQQDKRTPVLQISLEDLVSNVHRASFAAGRGDELHFWSGNQWLVFTIDNVSRQAELFNSIQRPTSTNMRFSSSQGLPRISM